MKQMFIGGRWLAAHDGRALAVASPADAAAFDQMRRGSTHEVNLAVAAAGAALGGPWGRLNATERGRLLQRRGLVVQAHEEELAQTERCDTCKPDHDRAQRHQGAGAPLRFLRWRRQQAVWPDDPVPGRTPGEPAAQTAGRHGAHHCREPARAAAGPHPGAGAGAGQCTALKPAADTSLPALRFAEIATAAGLPEGALNIVTGLGEEAGAALAAHPGIDFISSVHEEILGPVLAVLPFDDEADAVCLASDTDYGLPPALWTENTGRLQRVTKAVRAGQVFMNCYGDGGRVDPPIGGTQRSGHGREKGLLA